MLDIPYLNQIASQGLLGIFLALSLLANAFQYRENREWIRKYNELQEKRLDDSKENKAVLENITKDNLEVSKKTLTIVEVLDHKGRI